MSAWLQLPQKEKDEVWDRFYDRFSFHPSVHEEHWPGIREPVPCLTYSIADAFTGDEAVDKAVEADLHTTALAAFRQVVSPSEHFYALDWQHNCFRFYPHHEFPAHDADAWAVPVLPNGDYYIFLGPDFSFGTFGHPWESSICIFGKPMLAAFERFRPKIFTRLLRRDGRVA